MPTNSHGRKSELLGTLIGQRQRTLTKLAMIEGRIANELGVGVPAVSRKLTVGKGDSNNAPKKTRKRRVTAQARAAQSAAMKARWAKLHVAERMAQTQEAAPVQPSGESVNEGGGA